MMESRKLAEAMGYRVGDLLLISAEAFETRVRATTPRMLLIDWPYRERDPRSENSWDGTIGLPRESDGYGWRNTPWRVEPDSAELESGDSCFVGIPATEVRVTGIEVFEPPADFGFLPRPDYVLEVVPVDLLGDEDAGFVLYLNGDEPIDIEIIESAG